ncbi:hypothetical protein AB0K00_21100 [Dactylosporangium sp. NPDC049525]|uniref:hypothetical protein n=1 Tax=Dactylosporangium sp. NPDC049525 TaxID=3154730 RepID=UPI003446C984
MPESTPAAPEPIDDGISEAPETPVGEASGVGEAPSGAPDKPTHGPGSPSPDGPQRPAPPTPPTAPTVPADPAPAGGRGGCMSMVLGVFMLLAVLLGIATQL